MKREMKKDGRREGRGQREGGERERENNGIKMRDKG